MAFLEFGKGDDLFRTENGLFERYVKVIPEVIALCGTLSSVAAEAAAEDVTEKILKDITEARSGGEAARTFRRAEPVVMRPFLRVAQTGICLINLLELCLGVLVSSVAVGMMFECKLPEGFL